MTARFLHICITFFHLCTIIYPMYGEPMYEFVLGGLFPVHQRGIGSHPCGDLLKEKGIQRLEAMLYAIDKINDNPSWNFRLIPKIVDTCSYDSFALEKVLNFLPQSCNGTGRRVTGVIGAANSPVSETVASVFRLFKIPQISYASTSRKLDDLDKFPYFFRVVPSDKFQVKVIIDLLRYLEWTFVSFVAAEGDYGEDALEDLKKHLANEDICIAEEVILPKKAEENNYLEVLKRLRKHEKAKGVIVFLNEDKLKMLLYAAQQRKGDASRILWLGSDSWGAKINPVKGQEDVAEGAITILPKRYPVHDFDQYFKKLRPRSNTRNPWFKEFWRNQFNCNSSDMGNPRFNRRRKPCTDDESLESVKQEGLVPMVIDAVNVMAYALKRMCEEKPVTCRDWEKNPDGSLLKKYIEQVEMKNTLGSNMIVSFDDKKSIPVNYTIFQFRKMKNGKEYEYVEITEWNPATRLRLENFKDRFTWPDHKSESSCGKPCNPGEERNKSGACCWTCRPCDDDEYLPSPKHACDRCEEGFFPSKDRTFCQMLEPEYLGKYMTSAWAVVPIIFAVLGIITTTVTGTIFYAYRKTPIIMASGRELCYLIFLGVAICYSLTFAFVAKPTPISCGMIRGFLGVGLSLCYASIFTKTNRLSRIFNRTLRSAKRPRYITPRSQLVICLSLVSIQGVLSTLWLLLDPPDTVEEMESPTVKVMNCRGTSKAVFMSLAYNVFLVVLCTVYAFKTRKIPENFNEAKYISFAMYTSCIIWLAFIPIFFTTWNDFKVHNAVMSMSVGMCGTVALVCIFFPKLYIVIFDPEKNVRFPTTSNSTSGVQRPVRFVRQPPTSKTVILVKNNKSEEGIAV